MQVNNIQSTNPNFGMAVKISSKANKILEDRLTLKGVQKLQRIVEAEKKNPTNVHITTEERLLGSYHTPSDTWTPYDHLIVKVEDKKFETGFMSIFSESNAIISTIKKGVKHAQKLTEKRNILNNIAEK